MSQVKQPSHYTLHPSGIECKFITMCLSNGLSNSIKYVWRRDHKHHNPLQDLSKAIEYLQFEIEELLSAKAQNEFRHLCQPYQHIRVSRAFNKVIQSEKEARIKKYYDLIDQALEATTTMEQVAFLQRAMGVLNFAVADYTSSSMRNVSYMKHSTEGDSCEQV